MNRGIDNLRERCLWVIEHPRFVPACLASGILVRLVWIWLVDSEQVSDYLWYEKFAINIANGRGYSVNGVPTGYWPIGYPGFLGALFYLFGPSVFIGKLANIVLYVGTILLTYKLSKDLFHCEPAARVTLCILSFYPNHIAYTALLSSEILFVFLVALSAVLFVSAGERVGLLLLCGLSWGLATLTKPQALLLPFIFLFMFSRTMRSGLKGCIVIYVALILTILPWMVRNYFVMGTPTLANTAGIDLFDGNNPYATGVHNFNVNMNELLGDLKTIPLENVFDGKEVARDVRAREVAIDYIHHNPGRVIALLPRKFVGLFRADIEGVYFSLGLLEPRGLSHRLVAFCARAAQLYYAVMLVLFLSSVPMIIGGGNRPQLIGFAVVLYFTALYLVFFGNYRYHFPMMPWVAIYSGVCAQRLIARKGAISDVLVGRRSWASETSGTS
jgi:4-amino-4-deoxy-L-arabinose transferase-like glycosyltransferase